MKPRSARNGSCGFGLGWIASEYRVDELDVVDGLAD
jgi:hypothetical protein